MDPLLVSKRVKFSEISLFGNLFKESFDFTENKTNFIKDIRTELLLAYCHREDDTPAVLDLLS